MWRWGYLYFYCFYKHRSARFEHSWAVFKHPMFTVRTTKHFCKCYSPGFSIWMLNQWSRLVFLRDCLVEQCCPQNVYFEVESKFKMIEIPVFAIIQFETSSNVWCQQCKDGGNGLYPRQNCVWWKLRSWDVAILPTGRKSIGPRTDPRGSLNFNSLLSDPTTINNHWLVASREIWREPWESLNSYTQLWLQRLEESGLVYCVKYC